MVADLAREYGIPAVRLAREDWRTTLVLPANSPSPKIAEALLFAWLPPGRENRPGCGDWSLDASLRAEPTMDG